MIMSLGGGSVAGGSGLASLDLVDFDALRFRNNFLQVSECVCMYIYMTYM